MKAAKKDFEHMCKTLTDRQADFLTRGLFLEEQLQLFGEAKI